MAARHPGAPGDARTTGPVAPPTLWTPVGLIVLCLLLFILTAREFIRYAWTRHG